MKLEPFDCLGLKDMHKDQISTLMEFVATALNAAAEVEDDGECLNDMQEKADELSASLVATGLPSVSIDPVASGIFPYYEADQMDFHPLEPKVQVRYPDVSSVWQAAGQLVARIVQERLVVRFVELLGPAVAALLEAIGSLALALFQKGLVQNLFARQPQGQVSWPVWR